MFSGSNKKTAQKIDEIDTVIGPGTSFEGNVNATGIVRIDGVFRGEITTKGDIIVGEQGKVSGSLSSNNMIIAGNSDAALMCSGKLEIRATGKVVGDIEVDSIIIEDKALFNGQCKMKNSEDSVETSKKVVSKASEKSVPSVTKEKKA